MTSAPSTAASAGDGANFTCLVCSGPSNGICHFGVQCCRACASFFHRSVKEKRKYTCRWNQRCRISSGDGLRNSCRACRLKKCLQMGMAEEKKRDRKSNVREEQQGSFDPSPDESSFFVAELGQLDSENIPKTTKFADSLRQFNNALRALSVMEGICTEFAGNEDQKARVINHDEYVRMLKGSALLTHSMLCQHLPAIRNFSLEIKVKLLKFFHNQFHLLSVAELTEMSAVDSSSTTMVFPGALFNRATLREHFFFNDNIFLNLEQKQKLEQFVDWHLEFFQKRYFPLHIGQLEFAAITGIIFWNALEKTVPNVLSSEEISLQREALYAELYSLLLNADLHGNAVRTAVRFGKHLDLINQLAIHASDVDELWTMARIFMDFPDIWDDLAL